MSAETGNEPDSPKRHRGRIPQSAWPQILQRHRAGVTLSAIAREFDCTPSAISYIVRKAEAVGIEPDETLPEPAVVTERPMERPTSSHAGVATTPPPPPVPAAGSHLVGTLTSSALRHSAGAAAAVAAPPPAPVAAPVVVGAGSVALAPPEAIRSEAIRSEPARPAASPEATRSPVGEAARPNQPPPVDAVEARLRETARGCLVAYRGWRQSPGETSIQSLNDAVHDLRKVLARIEIDMSSCRREEQVLRPIPVPPHRASRPAR